MCLLYVVRINEEAEYSRCIHWKGEMCSPLRYRAFLSECIEEAAAVC